MYTEIRELDSERQSLVYNHHHELLAASDTIAAVRATVVNLLSSKPIMTSYPEDES